RSVAQVEIAYPLHTRGLFGHPCCMRHDQDVIEKRAGALYLFALAVCGGQIGLHRCVRPYKIGTG
ncbi:MAG TPA: hypothetical protein VKJ83_01865, partial [Actinomycetota bacterium]|nr:hypothetical protein [Actinomycetota bacterium]